MGAPRKGRGHHRSRFWHRTGGAEKFVREVAKVVADEFDRFISVNLTGVMRGTKHGILAMLPSGGGAILTWSSTGGMNGSRLPTAAYSSAKAGVISLTKAAAIEYGTQGVRANAIYPGFVETAMSGGKGAGDRFHALVKGSALQRAGQPEEVAELVSFLASDRATLITGAVIAIDGGSTCMLPNGPEEPPC